MNIFRSTITLCLLLAMSLPLTANNRHDVLLITMKDSTRHRYILSEKPVVTFDRDKVYVNSDLFSAEFSAVESFSFLREDSIPTTSIGSVLASELSEDYTFLFLDGRTVQVYGCPTNATVGVYAINGVSADVDVERSDRALTIHLSALPAGVYVIKVNTQSYKIYKR